MSKFSTLFFGIGLSSVILASQTYADDSKTVAADTENGNLALVANGEDFVRQGFVSKDDWQIDFDHLYVSIDEAVAYATESAFEPQKGVTKESIDYQEKVVFVDSQEIVDLAAGDTDAEPILVGEADVASGFYNALSWQLATAPIAKLQVIPSL